MPEVRPGDRFNDWEIVTPLVRQHNQRALCLCHGCGCTKVRYLRPILHGNSKRCSDCRTERLRVDLNDAAGCELAHERHRQGWTYQRIADEQGISVSSAYRRVRHGYRMARKEERSNGRLLDPAV